MSGAATFGIVIQINIMLGFEFSLKISLPDSSVLLQYLSKTNATPIASLSVPVAW